MSPYFYGVVQSGANFVGPLDQFATKPLFAVSARRLLSTYLADQSRLRAAPSATEGNIGFSADYLNANQTQMAALLGGTTGRLVTWYDQSPVPHDLSQTSASPQPLAAEAITINGRTAFQGLKSSHLRASTASFNWGIGTDDFLISLIVRTPTFENWSAIFSFGTDNPSFYCSAGAIPVWTVINPGVNSFTGVVAANTNYVITLVRESGTTKLYINGILNATTFGSISNSIGTTTLTLFEDSAAGIDGGSCSIQEFLVYPNAMASDRATLMANQIAYAGV